MRDEQWLRVVELQNLTIASQHQQLRTYQELTLRKQRTDRLLSSLNQRMVETNMKFDDLEREIAESTDVTASAATLLESLSQQIKDAAGDPAKLAELTAQLNANSSALAAAVAANTPAQ